MYVRYLSSALPYLPLHTPDLPAHQADEARAAIARALCAAVTIALTLTARRREGGKKRKESYHVSEAYTDFESSVHRLGSWDDNDAFFPCGSLGTGQGCEMEKRKRDRCLRPVYGVIRLVGRSRQSGFLAMFVLRGLIGRNDDLLPCGSLEGVGDVG